MHGGAYYNNELDAIKNDVITTARESHVTYHTYNKNHPVSVNEEKKRSCFQQMCCMLTTQNTALEGTYMTEKNPQKLKHSKY